MPIPEMSNAAGLLAGGGVIAILVTAWSKIKEFMQYIVSIVVVQAKVDGSLSDRLDAYLRKHWQPVPSGMFTYASTWMEVHRRQELVPFHCSNKNSLFFYRGRVLFLKIENNSATILVLRGTVDIESIIVKSILFYEELNQAIENSVSRYRIVKRIGHANGYRQMNGVEAIAESPISSSVRGSMQVDEARFHTSVNRNLRFTKEELQESSKEDPFDTVYFPPSILEHVEQAKSWVKMRDWYQERAIPWKRGWMLHGIPGTGKSTLASALAKTLGIPIYQFYLSTMSDEEFIGYVREMDRPCVMLFEDFDNVFDKRTPLTEHKALTFDCVLNEISGVGVNDGVFLIVTTNDLSKIDPAMGVAQGASGMSTRPGRIDSVIEVGLLNEEGKRKLASRVLKDWPDLIDQVVSSTEEITPIQFQELCLQTAFSKLQEATKYVT